MHSWSIRRRRCTIAVIALGILSALAVSPRATGATVEVQLIKSEGLPCDPYNPYDPCEEGSHGFEFSPAGITINVGDTITWVWASGPHSVTSGTPGQPSGLFDSGIHPQSYTFSHTFTQSGDLPYYCMVHGSMMTGSVKVLSQSPSPALVNLSTRVRVETGEDVLIAGFIIDGSAPKRLALRGLGPSLQANGQTIIGTLPNPILELRGSSGTIVSSNDDWQAGPDAQELANDGLAPPHTHEAALLSSLAPGSYTAILRDAAAASGIGLVELYDIDQTAASAVVNISTRASVQTGDDVMIGGFIIGGSNSQRVIVRAIGPSLSKAGITNALADPVLELHNASGTIIGSNDNWRSTQEADISATGVAPEEDIESAIVTTLVPAAYTAVVRGANGKTGVGLVEAYQLGP